MLRLLGLALALVVTAAEHDPASQSAPTAEILERYSRGERVDELIRPYLRTSSTYPSLVRDFERAMSNHPSPLMATFALDAARLAFAEPTYARRGDTTPGLNMLEVACAVLRQTSTHPPDFEIR